MPRYNDYDSRHDRDRQGPQHEGYQDQQQHRRREPRGFGEDNPIWRESRDIRNMGYVRATRDNRGSDPYYERDERRYYDRNYNEEYGRDFNYRFQGSDQWNDVGRHEWNRDDYRQREMRDRPGNVDHARNREEPDFQTREYNMGRPRNDWDGEHYSGYSRIAEADERREQRGMPGRRDDRDDLGYRHHTYRYDRRGDGGGRYNG